MGLDAYICIYICSIMSATAFMRAIGLMLSDCSVVNHLVTSYTLYLAIVMPYYAKLCRK